MKHVRLGDAAVLLIGAGLVAASAVWAWRGGSGAEVALIRAGGAVVRTVPLDRAVSVTVAGPLGLTRIDVAPGRARVAADPSPRQLCVRQGWLTQPGQAALCLPNEVSLEIRGRLTGHDTRAY